MREFQSSQSDRADNNLSVTDVLPEVTRNWNITDDQLWWGKSYQQVFGQEAPSSNSKNSWLEIIHPDDKNRIIDSVTEAFNMQQSEWTASYRIKRVDDSYLDVHDIAVISYQANIPIQLVGFMKFSHSVQTNKVVEMQQIASMALEASDSASFTLVLENNSLIYSPGFSKMLTGDSDYQATRQIFLEHIHPDDISVRQEAYKVAEISGILTYEARFVWKDGSVHWIKILAKYVYDAFGRPISISGILTDISEQVEKRRALELAQQKFNFAFENAPVGMAFTDSDGIVRRINHVFAALLGETVQDLIGRSFAEFTMDYDLQESHRDFKDLIDGKQKYLTKEKRFLRKDEKEQWVRVTTNCFESDGEEKLLSIAYDINGEIQAIAQQKRLLSILDHSADIISVFDHEGKFTYVNKIGKKLLDITDLNGLTIGDVFSPAYAYRLKREILPLHKGARNWTGKQLYRNLKTDDSIDVMTHAFVLDDTVTGLPGGYASIGRDIRAELASEKKLRDSETLFRNITNASTAALWITDENGSLTYISKTWLEWTGEPIEMHLGDGWLNYVASEDLDRVTTRFWEDFNNRSIHDIQFCIVHVDKTVRCVVCKGSPQYNDKQEFTGYIGAILDITELVEAQKQLNSSEEMMRSMIQQSPVAIGLFETDALVVKSVNPAMLATIGKNETIIGTELTKAVPELEGQAIIEKFKQVLKSGQTFESYDTPLILEGRQGPESRYFNIVCAPIHGAENQINGVMVMSTDFTWQHQAQIELKANEKKFRHLIEQSPVACALFLGRDLVIEFSNEAMIKIWGKGDTVQGKKLMEALPELQGQSYLELLEGVYDSGQAYHSQSAPADLVVDGVLSTYYFDFSYTPLFDANGNVYGILDMAADVTERVSALHELQRNEKLYRDLSKELEARVEIRTNELNLVNKQLVSSNQSLEQFAYVASHDLQEPLRKVISFGSRLITRYSNHLDDDGKFLVARMQDAAARMGSMISDLLTFSRLQVNHKAFTNVDLNEIVASVLSDLEIVIEEKQALIDIEPLGSAWGDSSQLSQLLLNLINNALKYQPPGQVPHITISTAPADISELNQNVLAGHSYMKIQVKDNGIGFDQKNVDRIFQLFQRLHGKNEYTGSGIGLALCNKVVQNHYGLLTAESEIGKGSCFTAYLPKPIAKKM